MPWATTEDVDEVALAAIKRRSIAANRMLGTQTAPWTEAPLDNVETSASGFEVPRHARASASPAPWGDEEEFTSEPPPHSRVVPSKRPSSVGFKAYQTPWAEDADVGEGHSNPISDVNSRQQRHQSVHRASPWADTNDLPEPASTRPKPISRPATPDAVSTTFQQQSQ